MTLVGMRSLTTDTGDGGREGERGRERGRKRGREGRREGKRGRKGRREGKRGRERENIESCDIGISDGIRTQKYRATLIVTLSYWGSPAIKHSIRIVPFGVRKATRSCN